MACAGDAGTRLIRYQLAAGGRWQQAFTDRRAGLASSMASTDPADLEPEVDPVEMFPPHVLREYALLADGERGALVDPCGCCVDVRSGLGLRWGVLQPDRWSWRLRDHPDRSIRLGWLYEPGSLIWRSRWITETGIVECREALAFPGDPHRVVLLRRIIAVQGTARVRIVLQPAAGFGRQQLRALHRDATARTDRRALERRKAREGR